jgi:hypothetical protein
MANRTLAGVVRRLMQLIEHAAVNSGHPDLVFAIVSINASAMVLLILRYLIWI